MDSGIEARLLCVVRWMRARIRALLEAGGQGKLAYGGPHARVSSLCTLAAVLLLETV